MIINEINGETFKEFADKYPFKSIYQTIEYASIMKKQGYNYLFIGAFKDENLIGASLILIEKFKSYNYAYAPRGFLIDYNNRELVQEFTLELKKFLNKKDIVAIKISPFIVKNIIAPNRKVIGANPNFDEILNTLKTSGYYHYGFNAFFEAYKPRFEAMLDISVDYRLLFKNIKKEYKTKIRSAEKQGIKIYKSSINDINILYEQVKGTYPRSLEYFSDFYNYFSSNDKIDFYYAKLDTSFYLKYVQNMYNKQEKLVNEINKQVLNEKQNSNKLLARKIDIDRQAAIYKARLIEASNLFRDYKDGIVLSSILTVKNGEEIYLYMDGYNKQYRSFNSKHLIIWKIIEKYSKLGYKRLNLGGITDPRAKGTPYDGLVQFKTNFNCSTVEYIGDLELITNSLKYKLYRQSKKGSK